MRPIWRTFLDLQPGQCEQRKSLRWRSDLSSLEWHLTLKPIPWTGFFVFEGHRTGSGSWRRPEWAQRPDELVYLFQRPGSGCAGAWAHWALGQCSEAVDTRPPNLHACISNSTTPFGPFK